MNEEIKILYDEQKVIVTSQVLDKIKYLTRKDDSYSTEKKQLTNEIDIREFFRRIELIIHGSESTIQCLPDKDNEINYNTDLLFSLVQKYNELYSEEQRESDVIDMDPNILNELLNTIYQINNEINNFYLTRDLINAKKDCLENMKYFLNDVVISSFNNEYEKAAQSKDIKKMKDMINYVQQAILKEWERYFSNIDSMNNDNFTFIGHSTNSTTFDENFYSKYVSTSLFNQDLTDTYRSGYGFIFAPKKIVGAKSSDMYVNNYVQDEDIMLNYSLIKKIDHPQRLIDECLKLKQENIKNNNNQKVYNEVIIDGFEPIGIFCFTDGSKNLNWNYKYAQKLQESFPHLKIHSFDIMKRKTGSELDTMKLILLNNLQRKCANNTSFEINKDMLPRYDYFFEEYEKLKQKEDYSEEDIEVIFENNVKLLSIFNTDPADLFSGMYDEKQIKYILGKNVNYNIDYILSGKAKAFALNNLKKLYPYKDKLNFMYEGLSEFVNFVSRMEITDEMMQEINKNESLNFYTITKVLATNMINSINLREDQAKQNISNFQIEYNELQKELQERTAIQEQYDDYYSIYLKKPYVQMIKDDYNNLLNDINMNETKEEEQQTKLIEIMSELNEIEKRTELLETSIYDNNSEHISNQKIMEEIKVNLSKLSKHPILNRKRLKEEKNKLKVFEQKDITEKVNFGSLKSEEKQDLISKKYELEVKKIIIESDLKLTRTDKKQLYEQIDTLQAKVKNYFKCESVDEIDLVILKAKEVVNNHDISNSYYLSELKIRLEKLTNMIMYQQGILNDIEKEKMTISRNI